ncbi:MAG: hypothetical protein ACNI27_09510 [Desulfovibrio sp.]
MELNIRPSLLPLPTERAFVASMTIRSFKGRKNVEVHLFRPCWTPEEMEAMEWDNLLGEPVDPSYTDPESSKCVVMETFTKEERDQLIEYLKKHYSSRLVELNSSPMEFPVPVGLPALSSLPEGKTLGFIRFDKIPHFDLPFAVHGLYDLSCHEPIISGN